MRKQYTLAVLVSAVSLCQSVLAIQTDTLVFPGAKNYQAYSPVRLIANTAAGIRNRTT